MPKTPLTNTIAIAATTAMLVLAGCGANPAQNAAPAPDNKVEVKSSMSQQSLDSAEKALESGAPASYAELKTALFGTTDIISSEMYNAPVFTDATAVRLDPESAKDPAKLYQAAAIEDLCLSVQMTESLREGASAMTAKDYQAAYDRLATKDVEALMNSLATEANTNGTAMANAIALDTQGTKLCMDEIASIAKAAGIDLKTTTAK